MKNATQLIVVQQQAKSTTKLNIYIHPDQHQKRPFHSLFTIRDNEAWQDIGNVFIQTYIDVRMAMTGTSCDGGVRRQHVRLLAII